MTGLSREEVLRSELELLQSTFNKYDDLVFRGRNWFTSIWTALIGLAFSIPQPQLVLIASWVSALYFVLEGLMRHQYIFKYIERYRSVRSFLNNANTNIDEIAVYDLTDHYRRQEMGVRDRLIWEGRRLKESFIKVFPIIFYTIMFVLPRLVAGYVPSS